MDCALVFSWVRPYPGHEMKAFESLTALRSYFWRSVARSEVSDPLVFTLANAGLVIVRGQLEVLFDLIGRDDFVFLVKEATSACEGFCFQVLFVDPELERLSPYGEAGRELA